MTFIRLSMSKLQKHIFAFAIVAIFAILRPVTPTRAQQPSPSESPSLGDRVQKLEGDLGQILDFLKKQQAESTPTTSGASTSSTVTAPIPANQPSSPPAPLKPISLKPGAILEVWTLKSNFSSTVPPGASVGGMLDQGEYFNLLNFTEEPSLASLQSNRLALRWSGLFRAKDAGLYVFTLEWSKAAGKRIAPEGIGFWSAAFAINGQSLINESPSLGKMYYTGNTPFAYSASSEVQLEGGGVYPLTLLTFIVSQDTLPTTDWNYEKMKLTLKVRGPSDMTPKTITANDLFHKQ